MTKRNVTFRMSDDEIGLLDAMAAAYTKARSVSHGRADVFRQAFRSMKPPADDGSPEIAKWREMYAHVFPHDRGDEQ